MLAGSLKQNGIGLFALFRIEAHQCAGKPDELPSHLKHIQPFAFPSCPKGLRRKSLLAWAVSGNPKDLLILS
jgi:hypothetical protein